MPLSILTTKIILKLYGTFQMIMSTLKKRQQRILQTTNLHQLGNVLKIQPPTIVLTKVEKKHRKRKLFPLNNQQNLQTKMLQRKLIL